MKLIRKICTRLTDPVFYRKRFRNLLRGFRSFGDAESARAQEILGGVRRVVVFVAHPDDEVFCSGLICELKQRGVFVRVLCLTKGEGGPLGGHAREELGKVRAEEMRGACDALGVDELVFLGHIDPEGRGYKVYAPEVSVETLSEQIGGHLADIDLVISHGSGGEYWHPAHLLVHGAVKDAVARRGEAAPSWLSFSARLSDHPLPELVNWDDPALFTFDGSRYERARLRALNCHRTQLGLFSKFASGDHVDFIRYTAREAYALQHRGAALQIPETADESKGDRDHPRRGESEHAESGAEVRPGR